MKDVISKTALKTILIVLIALAVAFGVASLGFPSQMAGLFESMRAYSFATGYASLAYTYSPTTENLARCVDDSIFSGADLNIISFGDRLINDSGFDGYCLERSSQDADYSYFVYSNVALSKYNRGDREGALNTAAVSMEGKTGFPLRNVYSALSLRAIQNSDRDFCDVLYNIVAGITPLEDQQEAHTRLLEALSSSQNN